MGFFSRLFYTPPAREEWGSIALNIAQSIEKSSEEWLDAVVQKFENGSTDVLNTAFDGDAELAIKAYQLFLASSFIAENQYIPPEDGKDFADVLFASTCGTRLSDVLEFFGRYVEVADEGSAQLTRFTNDIAKYITGAEAPLQEMLLIVPSTIHLAWLNKLIVATHFKDESTASKVRERLDELAV
jgi:hypothetical protein